MTIKETQMTASAPEYMTMSTRATTAALAIRRKFSSSHGSIRSLFMITEKGLATRKSF